MYPQALFTIARAWKQSRCPLTYDSIKQLWYINTMEYYQATKRNSFESVLMKWVNLKPTIQTEVSPKEKRIIWKESESVSCSVVSDSAAPWDCSPPGPSVHGILKARIVEWIAIPFSRNLPNPGIESMSLHCRQILYYLSHQGRPISSINAYIWNLERWYWWTYLQGKMEMHREQTNGCGWRGKKEKVGRME